MKYSMGKWIRSSPRTVRGVFEGGFAFVGFSPEGGLRGECVRGFRKWHRFPALAVPESRRAEKLIG
jgi:hypothetical protein